MRRMGIWSTLFVVSLVCKALGGAYTATVLYPLQGPGNFVDTQLNGGPQSIIAGQAMGAAWPATFSPIHAILWTSTGTPIDLHPTNLSGLVDSQAGATDGVHQVGEADDASGNSHAILWNSSPDSAIDLSPVNLNGIINSGAGSIAGNQQAGSGWGAPVGGLVNFHPLLWHGTAASAVDLSPTNLTGITSSLIYATDGPQQVGQGKGTGTGNTWHAMLWSGTANSAVDLGASIGIDSFAFAVRGNQQVGWDTVGNSSGALLWKGTAQSVVSLTPTNLGSVNSAQALDTNGIQQVGLYGFLDGFTGMNVGHAVVWSGTADSAVDLHSFLPASGIWSNSAAGTIDASGIIYGNAYGSYQGMSGHFIVEWTPVPEPSAMALIALVSFGLVARRRRPTPAGRLLTASSTTFRRLG
jgi:hypothetical protein